MAEKFFLQVTAGPSYDAATHKVVNVNSSEPLAIKSEHMDLNLAVRIQNFRGEFQTFQPPLKLEIPHSDANDIGLPKGSPSTSPYFSHPMHTKDQYSIAFSFLPKKNLNGNSLLFGNDFAHPIRDRLPPGFSTAFKIVKWAIDPSLEGDPYADEPYLYGTALSSLNAIEVGDKAKTLPSWKEDEVFTENTKAMEKDDNALSVPSDGAKRMKYFLDVERRKKAEFDEGRVYNCDFFNPYLDFNGMFHVIPVFPAELYRPSSAVILNRLVYPICWMSFVR
jgi:Protein of unknown function (DUF1769)